VNFRVTHFCLTEMAGHIVVARTTVLKGVTPQASTTREAPPQAELRPTCAGLPCVNLPIILAPMGWTLG
jgi:hypothetical protein